METKKFEFNPFDRVLVRDSDDEKWSACLYSHKDSNSREYYHRMVGDAGFAQCIPYEGNEHLLGTTDSPVPKPWEPKLEETFFTILIDYGCPFYVTKLKWSCTPMYEAMYRLGNCFQTREEAEAMADKLNVLLKGKE